LILGLLIEKKEEHKTFGPTHEAILKEEFQRLRDADRYYYEFNGNFNSEDLFYINNRTMRDIIIQNTIINATFLPQNVFINV
jgi:hypothetical protein